MSVLFMTLAILTGFCGGFFFTYPQVQQSQEQQDDREYIVAAIEDIKIDDTVKKFYASIVHDQETVFQTLLKDIQPTSCLPHGTTPLSFAIEQKKYSYAQQLLLHDFTATVQDLQKAQVLCHLETDPLLKEQATIFVQFLTHHLHDTNVLSQPESLKRCKRGSAQSSNTQNAETKVVLPYSSIDFQFIQAAEKGDVQLMKRLKDEGANPNATINCMRAIDTIIAFAHLEALDFLLKNNITVTSQDIERAALYREIHATNFDCEDRLCLDPTSLQQYSSRHAKQEANLRPALQSFCIEAILRQRALEMLVHYRIKNHTASA
ncbi:MAG TPA: ankyrin repeat domain-containing protein [Candidatus Saccharimonadales bacterium]|nr:ankyrin repeat domain-containing protein [Candidatus Saccharimonadales bacterium]